MQRNLQRACPPCERNGPATYLILELCKTGYQPSTGSTEGG